MKLVIQDGQEYRLHFWHHQRGRHKRPRYMTELFMHPGPCEINKETGRCLVKSYHAETRCHTRLDTFHRENGRATVLDRLLKSESVAGREVFPRPVRIQIWNAYRAAGAKLPKARNGR